ncbi:MAG: Na+/H+ antiporter subunit E [Actinomycetota bacterium]
MIAALRIPATISWLTLLWIALWGSFAWANVLGGLAVAAVVTVVARTGAQSLRITYFRPHWAAWYVLTVLGKLIESNLRLAWEILTPGIGTHTAIIAVPMRGGSDAVVNLVANSITLTPGTMTVDVASHPDVDDLDDGDPDTAVARVTLYVHGMYAQDVEAVRHEILELEALALRAFGSPDDYLRAEADVVSHLSLLDDGPTGERALRRARRRAERGRLTDELIAIDPARDEDAEVHDTRGRGPGASS